MKKIAVIANGKSFAECIKNDYEAYFSKYADFYVYTTDEALQKDNFEEDAVILSSWRIFDKLKEKIAQNAIIEVASFTLSKENINRMKEIKGIKKALLVNYDYCVCMQVIMQFHELGFDDIELIPYYGNEEGRDPSVMVAVTPNEAYMAPEGVTVYNIGERVVSPSCMVRLAGKLGIREILDSDGAARALDKLALPQWDLDEMLKAHSHVKNSIRAVLEHIEDGILICDNDRTCYLGNDKAKELLKVDALEGLNIDSYIPNLRIGMLTMQKQSIIVTVEGKKMVFLVNPIVSKDGCDGSLVLIRNFEEAEEQQHQLRNRVAGKKYEARYFFDDIKGESVPIREAVNLAKRFAKSNYSVMILGESGTGKEVFAQSIHNESSRKKYNFVALNCAAIPENLLESELFGYEEGAFTGARKGGKIGYFELAHKGTLLLDEIGEMPLALQGKLLRVIEEHRVVRIGSSKPVDIDVRIIASTNRNLKELVDKGKFREDLYYRLNVLPVKLPPLKERGEDVIAIFDNLRRNMNTSWNYDKNVRERLLTYKWPGNIREVRNTVEYLDTLGVEYITMPDLPEYLRNAEDIPLNRYNIEQNAFHNEDILYNLRADDKVVNFIVREGRNLQLHLTVLEAMDVYAAEKKRVGRKQVKIWIDAHGKTYSEAEIRNSMHKLSEYGYLRVLRGRGGSEITPSGKTLFRKIKGFIEL